MNNNTHHIERDFSKAAKNYDELATLQYRVAEKLSHLLKKTIGNNKKQVLDIGCGTGFLSKLNKDYDWVQIDLSYSMCKLAKQNAICADMHALPFKDNSFEMITSSMAFQWGNIEKILHEISRILKPGGWAFMSLPVEGTLKDTNKSMQEIDVNNRVIDFISNVKLKDLIMQSGFSLEHVEVENYVQYFDNIIDALKSMKNIGGSNKSKSRNRPLTRGNISKIEESYKKKYGSEDGLPMSWNITYISSRKK